MRTAHVFSLTDMHMGDYSGILRMPSVSHDANLHFQTGCVRVYFSLKSVDNYGYRMSPQTREMHSTQEGHGPQPHRQE